MAARYTSGSKTRRFAEPLTTRWGPLGPHSLDAIAYLIEENRVLREHLPKGRRLLPAWRAMNG